MADQTWKITVLLTGKQIAVMDRLIVEIRLRHRVRIARSGLIGAVIEAAVRGGAFADDVVGEFQTTSSRRRRSP